MSLSGCKKRTGVWDIREKTITSRILINYTFQTVIKIFINMRNYEKQNGNWILIPFVAFLVCQHVQCVLKIKYVRERTKFKFSPQVLLKYHQYFRSKTKKRTVVFLLVHHQIKVFLYYLVISYWKTAPTDGENKNNIHYRVENETDERPKAHSKPADDRDVD